MKQDNHLDTYSNAYTEQFPYELDNNLILHWYPKRLATKLNPGSLLELGLGHGYSTKEFLAIVDKYTVIDGSSSVIEQFKQNNPQLAELNLIHSFFEDFQTTERFDNIVMGFILEHVDDPIVILQYYQTLLSENGKLFIAVPNAESLHRRLGFHAGLLDDLHRLSDADLALGHQRYFDISTLTKLIEQSNMTIQSIEGLFLKPLSTAQLQSLSLSDEVYQSMMQMGIDYPELSTALLVECSL